MLEAELVVPEEACGRDGEGAVAYCEAGVGQVVGLGEFEGVEVVWDSIVGGVLQIWWGDVSGLLITDAFESWARGCVGSHTGKVVY